MAQPAIALVPHEPSPAPLPAPKPERLASLDAYRGAIMIALASSGLSLAKVAGSFEGNPFWAFVGHELDHVAWRGCTFWDLIQPSFMFMAGVAVPYSYASRRAKGDGERKILAHTIYRSLLLVLLGVFLSSNGSPHTHWAFMSVLSQIGLGYTFVCLLRGRGLRAQALAVAAVLVGTTLLYALYPAPASGLAAHWTAHANVGQRIDEWFLNLFPPHDYRRNSGGYQTINFIPSLATMIAGLMAGEWLRGPAAAARKTQRLLVAAGACLVAGVLLDPGILLPGGEGPWTIVPIVKRLWSPSFAVFSTGWTLALLAAFYWLVDVRGLRRWAFPLVVVGVNSMAIYLMGQLMRGWVRQQLETHLPRVLLSGRFGPAWTSLLVLAVFWTICLWMYRRKIFLRI